MRNVSKSAFTAVEGPADIVVDGIVGVVGGGVVTTVVGGAVGVFEGGTGVADDVFKYALSISALKSMRNVLKFASTVVGRPVVTVVGASVVTVVGGPVGGFVGGTGAAVDIGGDIISIMSLNCMRNVLKPDTFGFEIPLPRIFAEPSGDWCGMPFFSLICSKMNLSASLVSPVPFPTCLTPWFRSCVAGLSISTGAGTTFMSPGSPPLRFFRLGLRESAS